MPDTATTASKRRQAFGVSLTLVALTIGTHLIYRAVHRDAVDFRRAERAFERRAYASAAAAYASARAAGFQSREMDLHQAMAMMRIDRLDEALEILRLRLRHDPADADLRSLAVVIAQTLSQPQAGLALYAVLGPRENLPLPDLVRLADLHQQAGQLEDALACVRLALVQAPAHPELHTLAGQYLSHAGRRGEAIAAFTTALDLDPAHRPARLALARNLAWEQRYAESAAAYRTYLGE